jgi:hypothetical protein
MWMLIECLQDIRKSAYKKQLDEIFARTPYVFDPFAVVVTSDDALTAELSLK